MSNSCESTWAGRFVICLQLVSWCAVGALLLHRGFTSVKREEVIKLDNATTTDNSYSQSGNQSEQIGNETIVDKPTDVGILTAKVDVTNKQTSVNEEQSGKESSSSTNAFENSTLSVSKSTPKTQTTPMHVHNVRVAAAGKRRYDLTPSGVVMAALGIVMLVVGPSVVILRCCESGRQGRRFNKLSADERALDLAAMDLPPAYDDVAGGAPRYSMLFPDEDSSVVYTDADTHQANVV